MKRAFAATLAALALVILAVGCDESEQTPPATQSDSPATGRSSGSPRTPGPIERVVLLTSRPADADVYARQLARALENLGKSANIATVHLHVQPADSGSKLIELNGEDETIAITDELKILAELMHGAQTRNNYRLVYIGRNGPGSPVETVDPGYDEGIWLCGVLASGLTTTRRVAAVGDALREGDEATTNAFTYAAGKAHERIQARSFTVADSTAEAVFQSASNAVALGNDVLFQATGRPGEVIRAAATRPNIFVIGFPTDQNAVAPDVVAASLVVDMDKVFTQILARARAGESAQLVRHGLADGVVRLQINPQLKDRVDDELAARLAEAERAIKAGEINVQPPPPPVVPLLPEPEDDDAEDGDDTSAPEI